MAGPTLDSANPPDLSVPPTGPGSKSPIDPGKGIAPTPIGGGKAPSPMGAPGRPANETPGLNPDDREAIEFLLEEINSIVDAGISNIKKIVIELLNSGWSEKRLKYLARLFEEPVKDFLKSLISLVIEHGIDKASGIIDKKLDKVEIEKYKSTKTREDNKKKYLGDDIAETSPLGAPPMGAPPMGVPPLGGPPKLSSTDVKRPDVNLYNNILRGGQMAKKLMIKGGALVEASTNPRAIVNNLLSLMRKAKTSVKSVEDLKIKYAGVQVIRKRAADDMMGGMGGGMGAPGGMDMGSPGEMDKPMGDESLPMEDEEGEGVLDEIKETIESIDEKVEEIADAVGAGEKALDEGLEESEDEESEDKGKELSDLDSGLAEAKELIPILKKASKEAKKFVEIVKVSGFPFEKKDKKEDKKEEKDEKKDKKEDKKEEKDEKKEKKSFITKEDLVKKVEARLKEIRAEKEANLYPFKNEIKSIPSVDNINAETARNQISTADKEIKGQPAKDKGYKTVNPPDALADLSYKEDKGTAGKKKVSFEVAERIRKHSMEDVSSKARCAVELAAQQQLKGLIEDPLKAALLTNMKEAGINEDLAKIIVHNAYIDGYEGSHKAIMEEAFETFMNKDIDDFVKVAKFVKEYKVADNNSVENVTSDESDSREKSASTVPIRGTKVSTDRRDDYKNYWKDVDRDRRGF